MENFRHLSIMKNEVLEFASTIEPSRILDVTLGGGGHAEALLDKFPSAELLGLDRDFDAIQAPSERLKSFGNRFHPVNEKFSNLGIAMDKQGWPNADLLIADLGVSSYQFDF